MEDQVDGAELMGEAKGDRVGAWFPYYIIWAQVFLREFLGWSSGPEELCLDISLVADIQFGHLRPVFVHILPIPLLSLCDVLLQLCLDAFQISHECLCFSRCDLWVVAFICEEWGHPCCCIRGIVVGEL